MKILSVDFDFFCDDIDKINFNSYVTFLDYDIVFLNHNAIMDNYNHELSICNNPLLNTFNVNLLRSDIERRKLELNDFFDAERLFVSFVHKPLTYEYLVGSRGQRGQINIFPETINTTIATGVNMEFRNHNLFHDFWITNEGYMYYEAFISSHDLTPFIYINGTDKAVGAYKNYNLGYLLILPTPYDREGYNNNEDCKVAHEKFTNSVIRLYVAIFKDKKEVVLPEWTRQYLFDEEKTISSEIIDVRKRYDDAFSELKLKEDMLEEIKKFKLLYVGTGDQLLDQVKKIFEQLGFEIKEADIGRDDIVMFYNNQPFVVEVKGVSNTAAEKHAAQLEKWVSGYFIKNKVKAKGILVVNAHKDVPIKERDDVIFPDQMLEYSRDRNHCLISGLQLLCLYLDIVREPCKKDKVITELIETNGVFGKYNDWHNYINKP